MEEDLELLGRIERAVDARLSGKRLKHVHSVSETAASMARTYGVNEFDARVAGLLHDWDKLLTDAELPARVDELGIERPEHMELLLPVLHSFTGAKAVRREFPELTDDIESAIWHHTLGGLEMSPLDMVIFTADMVEPLRKPRPGLPELRAKVGEISLDELYFEAYILTMRSLVDRKRFIHPLAFDIWNGLVEKHHPVDVSKQGNADVVL